MKKIVTIILFLLVTAVAQDEAAVATKKSSAKKTVAVFDFESQGISESESLTFSERFRTEIGNTGAIRLIERKALEKIMEEQGLQQSGCTTDECAAEVGQLLGAQNMINGSIGRIGNSYTVDIKMFSVETGETERTASATYDGEIDGLLVEIQILAWEIVGMEAPTKLKLQREGETALSTLAVMDFEGRGITMGEAETLTDRLITELSRTKKVILVERGTMNDVLNEQGYETAGCTSDECAAEVGALLGVDLMVSGAIGKIGNTYTIDAKIDAQQRTIYTIGMSASRKDSPPVILKPGSRIRVQGKMDTPHAIWFGVTLRRPNGDFAGHFQIVVPAERFQPGKAFDVTLNPEEYHLDPSLKKWASDLAKNPFDLKVGGVWCHSLWDSVGLQVNKMEILAPEESGN